MTSSGGFGSGFLVANIQRYEVHSKHERRHSFVLPPTFLCSEKVEMSGRKKTTKAKETLNENSLGNFIRGQFLIFL